MNTYICGVYFLLFFAHPTIYVNRYQLSHIYLVCYFYTKPSYVIFFLSTSHPKPDNKHDDDSYFWFFKNKTYQISGEDA
jgi:hypothetical protein